MFLLGYGVAHTMAQGLTPLGSNPAEGAATATGTAAAGSIDHQVMGVMMAVVRSRILVMDILWRCLSAFSKLLPRHVARLNAASLLCVAVIAACGFPWRSFAQTGTYVFVLENDWYQATEEIDNGCRSPNGFPRPLHEPPNIFVAVMFVRVNLIDYEKKKETWKKLPICSETAAGAQPALTPTPVPRSQRPVFFKLLPAIYGPGLPTLPSRFCSQQEKNEYIADLDSAAKQALDYSIQAIQYDKLMIQTLSGLMATTTGAQLQEATKYYQQEENWALDQAAYYHNLSNQLHSLALAARRIPVEKCDGFGYMGGSQIKLGGELGWGGSRNGFEDYHFGGNGVIGGISGQVSFPIGGGAYTGFGGSVLGSGVSGSKPDPITSNIRLLVPIDGILGVTFTPNGSVWPLSLYGFGGLAIGDVNISASPFSATQTMTGWSLGVGADLQLSPIWSVGLKYRHFDLGNANFSVFPGGTSFVTERGDMVTGTLSYHFPISPPAPVAPILTK